MEKYIEEIIEIVLDNVSCEHPQADEYSAGGGSMALVEYSLINEQEVIKKCLAVIPKAKIEVEREWIEEKASGLAVRLGITDNFSLTRIKNFILSFINEVSEKINLKGD